VGKRVKQPKVFEPREIQHWYQYLSPPPLGYKWKHYTYIPTEERVVRGWPPSGKANFLVPVKKPRQSHLTCFSWQEELDMKRYRDENQKKRGKWVPSTDPIIAKFPTINQFCSDCQWEDGSSRLPCNLKFKFGDDQVTMTLTDDEAKEYVSTTAGSSIEALELLEEALKANRVTWRSWDKDGKKKR